MANKQAEWSLEAVFFGSVTVGERGQVVIPAEARKEYGIKPGDKLLAFRSPSGRGLVLVEVDDMRAMLDQMPRWEALVRQLSEEQKSGEESEEE
ncbi:MAG TPA: AbrB/MazE/SpoVT family DNA-binding domain-containing protein [Armatimonadota bacterium]|nr:AbrB/MazE/SpoVT family DNA-binding domain-containing protein [Armatimonadota bacterium]